MNSISARPHEQTRQQIHTQAEPDTNIGVMSSYTPQVAGKHVDADTDTAHAKRSRLMLSRTRAITNCYYNDQSKIAANWYMGNPKPPKDLIFVDEYVSTEANRNFTTRHEDRIHTHDIATYTDTPKELWHNAKGFVEHLSTEVETLLKAY